MIGSSAGKTMEVGISSGVIAHPVIISPPNKITQYRMTMPISNAVPATRKTRWIEGLPLLGRIPLHVRQGPIMSDGDFRKHVCRRRSPKLSVARSMFVRRNAAKLGSFCASRRACFSTPGSTRRAEARPTKGENWVRSATLPSRLAWIRRFLHRITLDRANWVRFSKSPYTTRAMTPSVSCHSAVERSPYTWRAAQFDPSGAARTQNNFVDR